MSANFKNPMNQEVSKDQRDRLSEIACYGPVEKQSGDPELEKMGLVEFHGQYVDARFVVGRVCYYDANNGRFLPKVI